MIKVLPCQNEPFGLHGRLWGVTGVSERENDKIEECLMINLSAI